MMRLQPASRGAAVGLAVLTGLAATASPARANDGFAEIGAGGLVFLEAPAGLEMVEEDLTIAADRVRVSYLFRNSGSADQTARVAFPLPSVTPSTFDELGYEPDRIASIPFSTTVDGQPVAYETERRAFGCHGGIWYDTGAVHHACCASFDWSTGVCEAAPQTPEVTDLLQRHGLLGALDFYTLSQRLEDLSPEARQALAEAGALDPYGEMANWSVRTIHHREQVFPAGQTVQVVHSYDPLPGAAVWGPDDLDVFGTIEAVRYILKTATTWSGPIRQFRLTVAPASPDGVVAVAGLDGLSPAGDGTYRLELQDFTPTWDVTVTFFPTRMPTARELGVAAYRDYVYGVWRDAEIPLWLSPGATDLPPGRFPGASLRPLTPAEMEYHAADDLAEMRNEIFARHGHVFQTDRWREHFAAQPWYRPVGDASGRLTDLERANIAIIQAAEADR